MAFQDICYAFIRNQSLRSSTSTHSHGKQFIRSDCVLIEHLLHMNVFIYQLISCKSTESMSSHRYGEYIWVWNERTTTGEKKMCLVKNSQASLQWLNTQWFALSWLYVHEISDGRLPCALVQHIYYFEVNHKQMRTGFSIVVHRHVHWSLFHRQTVWLSCEIFSMSISVRTIQLRTSNGSHWTFLCLFFMFFFWLPNFFLFLSDGLFERHVKKTILIVCYAITIFFINSVWLFWSA